MNPYGNFMINEAEVMTKWSPVVESTTGITEKAKLSWMSKYCHYHELYENNATATLGSVNGMGNTAFPSLSGTDVPGGLGAFGFNSQNAGSGDKAHTLLPLAMQVAANTIGLDLVPVVPMPGPMGVLTYLDFIYGGGKLDGAGSEDNPLLIKVDTGAATVAANTNYYIADGATSAGSALYVEFLGKSRIDGFSIFKVESAGTIAALSYTAAANGGPTISDVLDGSAELYADGGAGAVGAAETTAISASATLVKGLEDHITGFSGGNYSSPQPYSRGAGESTRDNVMNLSLYNKSVEAETFQVAAAVTREQVQDLKQFGIDAVSQVESVLVNELTQSINKNILDHLFRLGSKNHGRVYDNQGVSLHLNIGTTARTLSAMGFVDADFVDSDDVAAFNTAAVSIAATENASVSSAENLHTRQRKIMSKMLAASNLIAIRGRRGAATFAVTNGQIATALQDTAGFVPAPMANAISQMGGALYPVGTLAGIAVYVDPNMEWSDLRIMVGRKGDGNSPGLVFMPYLMADSVETIAEGTMAPKIAIKSRYALVEAGHHPEANYLTFGVYTEFGSLV